MKSQKTYELVTPGSILTQADDTDCFPAGLAFRYGVVPALVVCRVAAFCRDTQTFGPPLTRMTQNSIARTFDYIQPATVIKAIQRLTAAGVLLHGPRCLPVSDKPHGIHLADWIAYSVPRSVWEQARTNPIVFSREDARRYGLRTAILLSEIRRHPRGTVISPAHWARRLPLGITTIRRKLRELEAAGIIVRCRGPDGKPVCRLENVNITPSNLR